jgi:hypothetical protein
MSCPRTRPTDAVWLSGSEDSAVGEPEVMVTLFDMGTPSVATQLNVYEPMRPDGPEKDSFGAMACEPEMPAFTPVPCHENVQLEVLLLDHATV